MYIESRYANAMSAYRISLLVETTRNVMTSNVSLNRLVYISAVLEENRIYERCIEDAKCKELCFLMIGGFIIV